MQVFYNTQWGQRCSGIGGNGIDVSAWHHSTISLTWKLVECLDFDLSSPPRLLTNMQPTNLRPQP